uniref:DNA-binding domain-containing protein n=1 Tax=Candidatus Kentrum sp. FW TaxID=2126338 RepID=A0A450U2T6_9GAMM|nr:MAG: Putative DNA-binding domain-containing protein [Candidatus Kentron sp. FW]
MTEEIINLADVCMLVVEDTLSYWEELRASLEDYGYRAVELAENPEQAIERLETGHFDVIIADMRFGKDARGGFSVLKEVKNRNITSVLIVLTANDNWQDCRESFRGGAWDYLSKTMPDEDVIEILHRSILDALEYVRKYGSRSDELWVWENHERLLHEYPNQYIAVMNNTVIDSNASREALLARIHERNLPLLVPIVRYMDMEDIHKLSVDEIIERDEGDRVEFKRTFLGSDAGDDGKKAHGVLRTIAAFLNSRGGVLLIGVEDDKNIFGLEEDYKSLGKKPNRDGFNTALTNRITDSIGATFMPYITIGPHSLEGKEIAVVRVRKAPSPAFVKFRKRGDLQEYFYIRAGATNRPLGMEETYHHLCGKMRPALG